MNTKFCYFHKDENNDKTYYKAILSGFMSEEQHTKILNGLTQMGTFTPAAIGLKENLTCECYWIEATDLPATVPMSVEDFVSKIQRASKCFTWDDIYVAAEGTAFGSDELTAKDEARWQVRNLAMSLGAPDLDECECPEDQVESYCDALDIRFDVKGNVTKICLPKEITDIISRSM